MIASLSPSRANSALQKRNVFVEELLLQILGAGGNDDALAAVIREQICEGLAGTGAGLDDQVTLFFDGGFDGLCHLQLSATEFVGRVRFARMPPGAKKRWSVKLPRSVPDEVDIYFDITIPMRYTDAAEWGYHISRKSSPSTS